MIVLRDKNRVIIDVVDCNKGMPLSSVVFNDDGLGSYRSLIWVLQNFKFDSICISLSPGLASEIDEVVRVIMRCSNVHLLDLNMDRELFPCIDEERFDQLYNLATHPNVKKLTCRNMQCELLSPLLAKSTAMCMGFEGMRGSHVCLFEALRQRGWIDTLALKLSVVDMRGEEAGSKQTEDMMYGLGLKFKRLRVAHLDIECVDAMRRRHFLLLRGNPYLVTLNAYAKWIRVFALSDDEFFLREILPSLPMLQAVSFNNHDKKLPNIAAHVNRIRVISTLIGAQRKHPVSKIPRELWQMIWKTMQGPIPLVYSPEAEVPVVFEWKFAESVKK